jgi:hypothetical protein
MQTRMGALFHIKRAVAPRYRDESAPNSHRGMVDEATRHLQPGAGGRPGGTPPSWQSRLPVWLRRLWLSNAQGETGPAGLLTAGYFSRPLWHCQHASLLQEWRGTIALSA